MNDCIICRKPIPDEPGKSLGNSASPLREGRCCDQCDMDWVVPVRLIMSGHTPDYAKSVGKLSHFRPPGLQRAMAITCPKCGMTSFNPNDVEKEYCGNCHQFHSQMSQPTETIT
jgi:ribosomal protein S27AE